MWIRMTMLMSMLGCVAAGDPGDEPAASVAQSSTTFHCLNHTAIHVVTCEGSISLFPITVTIESLRILSDNELTLLSDDLNDVSILDGGVLDHDRILNDVEGAVLSDILDVFLVIVTGNDIDVCTVVAGLPLCA